MAQLRMAYAIWQITTYNDEVMKDFRPISL
jgi:hypothetical protein